MYVCVYISIFVYMHIFPKERLRFRGSYSAPNRIRFVFQEFPSPPTCLTCLALPCLALLCLAVLDFSSLPTCLNCLALPCRPVFQDLPSWPTCLDLPKLA